VILIDQLKEIYIDGVLEAVDTTQWYPRLMRKDFTVGRNVSETAVDDPDQQFYENYVCAAERNYTGYCSPEVDRLVDQQSAEADKEKRKRIVWEIERRLAEDDAWPVIFYPRQATCRHAQVKGMTMMITASTTATATRTSGSTDSSRAVVAEFLMFRYPGSLPA